MKLKNLIILIILSIFVFIVNIGQSFALIKIDDESVNLAIKYSIKMKGMPTRDILGSNWLSDETGRILNIYSPFIQIIMKSTNQGTSGNPEEDIKNIKKILNNSINKIKIKNEIRFIIAIYGDKEDFAQKYNAYIIEADKYYSPDKFSKNKIKPKKINTQKIAERDGFHPAHPFSAVNCYVFKFDDILKLKSYYFVLTSENNEEILKYKINNNEIF
ncbi:MAG: hypothetical protein V2B14_03700 [bacterium]